MPSKFGPNVTLTTPQRASKLRRLGAAERNARTRIKRMQKAIESSADEKGVVAEPNLHETLVTIIDDKTAEVEREFPEGSFKYATILFLAVISICPMSQEAILGAAEKGG